MGNAGADAPARPAVGDRTPAGPVAGAPDGGAGDAGTRRVWGGVLRSAATRFGVLVVSALLGIVVTRLVIDHYGEAAFAQYGLLVGIGSLLPFTDLGLAAAVMDAVGAAEDPSTDERVRRVLVTAVRLLLVSAAVLAAVALVVTALGGWPALLGAGLLPGTGPVAALSCVLLIAAAIPLGVGQRIQTGLGKNYVSIAVRGLQTPLVLLVLLVCIRLGVPAGSAVAPVAYAATLLLAVVSAVQGARMVRPAFRAVLRAVPRVRSHRGAPVFGIAWPMLVQLVAVPLAMQSDRLVLSHRTTSSVLAGYNLAAQMFTPIWAVVTAGGLTLWPVFAKARSRGEGTSPFPVAWAFGAGAAAMSLAVGVAAPLLAEVASGGRIRIGLPTLVAFGALMTLQGLKYPLGMFLTDVRGLRYQALMITIMLPVNLGLSWVLAGPLGAAGPVIGSAVGVGVFEVAANAHFVRRRLRGDPRALAVPTAVAA